MKLLPAINWWPGNLRPHESKISFASRFCRLNHISLNHFLNYFNIDPYEATCDNKNICRISGILGERKSVVKSVMNPFFDNIKIYNYKSINSIPNNYIKYCKKCLAQGYHSRYHEISWITKCPWHLTTLDIFTISRKSGAKILSQAKFDEITELFENFRIKKDSNTIPINQEQLRKIKVIDAWLTSANEEIIKFYPQVICKFSRHVSSKDEDADVLSQMNFIKRMPKYLRDISLDFDDRLKIRRIKYSNEIASELINNISCSNMYSLYHIFKITQGLSGKNNIYYDELSLLVDEFEINHSVCKCRWAFYRDGWSSGWIEVDGSEWRPYNTKCPYEYCVRNAEFEWGDIKSCSSIRKALEIFIAAIYTLRSLPPNDFIERNCLYIDYFNDSEKFPNIWRSSSAITKILSDMARLEIDEYQILARSWLKMIESGESPMNDFFKTNIDTMYLVKYEKSIDLIKWIYC